MWKYGYVYGAGGLNAYNQLITVNWHTGATPTQGSSGANGQIRITYVSSQTLLAAIAPAAGTDSADNIYAAGYTGDVRAFHPTGTPVVAETWQNLVVPSGWSGYIRVRMLPESNMAFLDMSITHPALASKQNITISSSWPAAYRPATPQTLALQETNNPAVAAPRPSVFAGSGGTVTACNVDTGTTAIDCHAPYFIV